MLYPSTSEDEGGGLVVLCLWRMIYGVHREDMYPRQSIGECICTCLGGNNEGTGVLAMSRGFQTLTQTDIIQWRKIFLPLSTEKECKLRYTASSFIIYYYKCWKTFALADLRVHFFSWYTFRRADGCI